MLAVLSLSIPQFQSNHFPTPSLTSPPVPTKASNYEKTHNKPIFKTPNFPRKTPLISTQVSKIPNYRCCLRNPDAESTNFFSSKRLIDPKTFSSLLKSCSSLVEVKSIHAITLRLLDSPTAFVGNNLISSYIRFSSFEDARKLFDGMPERNVVSWTAIISGCLRMGLDEEALRLFDDSIRNQIQANSLTFVCVLKICGNLFDLELGRQIHASIVKGNWSNLIVDSALAYFYAQCGDLLGASIVFDRMPTRDTICWTTMITAYAQHGHEEKAFLMFSQMQHNGIHPNEFTVCSVLKACGEQKHLRFGRQLHGSIVKGAIKYDVFVGSSLVTMYSKCGEISDARLVFDLMPRRNTVTWTSIISGYAQNGLGEEAISLFKRMKRYNVFANSLTVVSILSACSSIGSLSLGKEVHGQALKNCSHGNIHIASTLISFYCKCGEYAYASRILEGLPSRGVVSWTAMISGYGSLERGSEALGFLNSMLLEGVEPNPFTYSSVLKICADIEAVREGRLIHASANKSTAMSNVFVGGALINMYMRCGYVADASRVFRTMTERNLVSWKIMIIGYAKNGLCNEALKLVYRMQAEGFFVDDFVLSTVLSSCGDLQWESECSTACSQTG